MDEENKVTGFPGDEEKDLSANTQADDLDNLAETFQSVYDETAQEAEAENSAEYEETFFDADGNVLSDDEVAAIKPKKEKKPKSAAKLVVITIFATIAALIVLIVGGVLVGEYLICGSLNPSDEQQAFFESISDYTEYMNEGDKAAAKIGTEEESTTAEGAEEETTSYYDTTDTTDDYYTTALDAYKSAVNLCTVNSWYCNKCKEDAVSAAVALISKYEGYADAYSYLTSVVTVEEASEYKDASVKSVIETSNKLTEAANKAPAEVLASTDTDAVCDAYGLPEDVAETFKGAMGTIYDAYTDDKADSSIDSKEDAITSYENAITSLVDIGVNKNEFTENLCAALNDNGCIFSAIVLSTTLDEDYTPASEGYKNFETARAEIKKEYASIYDLAVEAEKDGKTGEELLKDKETDESIKSLFASLIDVCVEAIKAENEKNLTSAANDYYSVANTLQGYGFEDASVVYKYFKTGFDSGNYMTLVNDIDTFATESVKASFTEEQTADFNNMQKLLTPLSSGYDIFSYYYQNYYYYGTLDTDALNEELDALVTDDTDNYAKSAVAYYKIYGASYTSDDDSFEKYLKEIKENTPDLIYLYGSFELSQLIGEGKIAKAVKIADEMLEINKADDYAIYVKALEKCLDKDYDASAKLAEEGIELLGSDSAYYCTKEAGVAYMLAGDYNKAYEYLNSYYSIYMSLDACDLMLILNYLVDDDSDLADDLKTVAEDIASAYEYYSATSYSDTLEILAGTKTIESVFAEGSGNLQNVTEETTEDATEETTAAE